VVTPRASDIAHRALRICNPISSATLDSAVAAAKLPAGSTAIDVGCGKGELLLRLTARYDVSAEGIDTSQARIDEAQAAARRRPLDGRLRFVCMNAAKFVPRKSGYSLTACVGATHALGGLEEALRTLGSWTVARGWVVVGEGFWMKEPDPEYLAAIGAGRDELGLEGWVEGAATRIGLKPVERWVSSAEDWNSYEDALLRGIEAFVTANPRDSEGPQMLAEQRAFHAAQVRWGRGTMGFAVHLLQKPGR
jgi:SAM-dependent methyltransferase